MNAGMFSDWFKSDFGEQSPETATIMRDHFLALVGTVVDYYGADGGEHEFKIDECIFKVLEDPDDGYRSHLGTIEYSSSSNGIFFKAPIAKVRIEEYDSSEPHAVLWHDGYSENQLNQGYRLVDISDNHVWLIFGTHNYDDYYPCFVFRHFPKQR